MTNVSFTPLPEPVSILMPICNERDVIENVVREWAKDVIAFLPSGTNLIFDDCSDDGTYEILTNLQKEFPWIRIVRSKKEGFFASAKRLYAQADNPWIFFTDSDGQYIPKEFWKLTPFAKDNDIVHGAKQNRKDPFYRVAASGAFNLIVRSQFRTPHVDVNSAFRLVRKSLADRLAPKVCHMKTLFNAELLLRSEAEGYRIKTVPVSHRHRQFGKSRGLPFKTFFSECRAAYRGLRNLRLEYAQSGNPAIQGARG